MVFRVVFFLILVSLQQYLFAQSSTWNSIKENGSGSVTINYYNSENFISDASGELKGMEYDLLESFFKYCENTYSIKIDRNYKKSENFGVLYDNIKTKASSGEFAACSFSITPERMKEVQFSPKYMADIEVLISSNNIPLVSDSLEFIEIFQNVTALSVPNTTFHENIQRLKKLIPSLKIENAEYSRDIINRISKEDNLFSYIELPNYILALKNGLQIKRQYMFKVERWGYGFIYPKESDWKVPIEEYFSSPGFLNELNLILVSHLEKDVHELIMDLTKVDEAVNYKELALLNKEKEIHDLEIKNRKSEIKIEKYTRYLLITIIVLVLIFVFFLQRQNIIKQKNNELLKTQNFEILKQKKIIEQKNNDVASSISYAQRIQHAALPSDNEIKKIFPNSFVYYQPKDVLSGDFYWVGETTTHTTSTKYSLLAVGDCTGHGIPGALLSLMGINNLNISRRKSDINSPAEALNFLNQSIKNTFSLSDNSIADGMDIAMIAIESTTLKLFYAAANRPIYIVRDNEVIILKGDNCSLGKQYIGESTEFTPLDFQLKKGDVAYLFSDGYVDQFGGEYDKKFNIKSFRKLILENQNRKMELQKEIIVSALLGWQGDTEQTDDICVFGFRV